MQLSTVQKPLYKFSHVIKTLFSQPIFKDKSVGAMAPSSRFLAAKMLNHVPIKEAKVIIELGPGTGVFTEKIIQKMGADTQLIVIELNDHFYEALAHKIQHPNVHLIHDSAEQIHQILNDLQLEKADLIISSLPLAMFPSELRHAILDAARENLRPKGHFVQFQYSLQAHSLLKKCFHKVKLDFTPFIFPPGFIYTCTFG